MGNNTSSSISKVNFEDVQIAIKTNNNTYLLINVLIETEQSCLIKNTLKYQKEEEEVINHFLQKKRDVKIIIYGKNTNDENVYIKYNQLKRLGFYNVNIFVGGMFMWLLLQDIYGTDEFPTTTKCVDILKFKEKSVLNLMYIEN